MRRTFYKLVSLAQLTVSAHTLPAAPPTPTPILQTLYGVWINPFAQKSPRAFVFLFLNTTCPIANSYAPEIARLATDYTPRGVSIFLVYPDPSENSATIQSHLLDFSLPKSAFRDPTHTFAKYTGSTVTPEAAVYSSSLELVYRGRIDNRHISFGQRRLSATKHDLAEAIESTLTGTAIPLTRTPAIGCYIHDLR
ncbi:MAG: hypothetical protein WCO60_14855 [Verrucomicrobiota bacterium]